jgi:hypothetical protein
MDASSGQALQGDKLLERDGGAVGFNPYIPFAQPAKSDESLAVVFALLFVIALVVCCASACRSCCACCTGERTDKSRGGCCPAPSVAPGNAFSMAAVCLIVALLHGMRYAIYDTLQNKTFPGSDDNLIDDLAIAVDGAAYVAMALAAALLALVTPLPPTCSRGGSMRCLGLLTSALLFLLGSLPAAILAIFDPLFYTTPLPDWLVHEPTATFCDVTLDPAFPPIPVPVPRSWQTGVGLPLLAACLALLLTLAATCFGCSSRPCSRSTVLAMSGLGGVAIIVAVPVQQLALMHLVCDPPPADNDDPYAPIRHRFYGAYDGPLMAGSICVILSMLLRWCAWGADRNAEGGAASAHAVSVVVLNPLDANRASAVAHPYMPAQSAAAAYASAPANGIMPINPASGVVKSWK